MRQSRMIVTMAAIGAVCAWGAPQAQAQAQTSDVPPSLSMSPRHSELLARRGAPAVPRANFTDQYGAPSAGEAAVVPLAPRGDNTAFPPEPDKLAPKK